MRLGERAWGTSEMAGASVRILSRVRLVQGAARPKEQAPGACSQLTCPWHGGGGRVEGLRHLPLFLSLVAPDLHATRSFLSLRGVRETYR